jgi:SecD/SecF fusion protein
LYFFGGPGIHAFAFSLVIGVISGSYSTVFIAAPILLWLLGKKSAEPSRSESRPMAKTA